MKVMFTFQITEDYIIESDDHEEAAKVIEKIWEKKQNSQIKDITKNNILYSVDVIEKYRTEEE
tara:strand:- start:111 stop:299 length:189 start_codon:yes stop_codon:yes gene_type:complete